VTERELFRLVPALDAAEAHGDELAARDELLVRVIEMAVRDRGWYAPCSSIRCCAVAGRTRTVSTVHGASVRVLLGDTGDDGRIEGAMLSGAISSAVMHPLVGDIEDDTLRTKLIDMSRRLLNLHLDGSG